MACAAEIEIFAVVARSRRQTGLKTGIVGRVPTGQLHVQEFLQGLQKKQILIGVAVFGKVRPACSSKAPEREDFDPYRETSLVASGKR